MNKLTLEHLAGYLPYGLNGMHEGKRIDFNTDNIYTFILNAKPILRPLSDLTKEIEVGGEKFVPIDRINNESPISEYYVKNINGQSYLLSNHRKGYNVLSQFNPKIKLYKWHFDIHNLISEGLAIDINKL